MALLPNWSGSASLSSYRCFPTCARTWCSATITRTFPAPYPDMERSIRGLKTQYRRMSGRKNWNAYLVRYGRCVAYAAWWEQDGAHRQSLVQRVAQLDRARWRELRR